ncbi:uncharacterized protein MONOS_11201 [Monocercomonoides exilis]|uniref:uncharacterized protein n=1 Tax=Monocercomonoides exilis TaxID=2049356 RepID=UPI00355A92A1|nr:hypothetical protein MONOS_11201 [Monocercomonoides exilis]|eukprot:MONOS_11201.1-p1 / transcript=MONOS_11201.1 / gene=MONOS_11201 / organism=Monocercomonoides_exilis_PA203 / gene_product=unspecified product / transcript_product=unspecified product / location=Mono_scaffold00550:7031-7964(+) / protein_length=255 / sequence_SO=supercontig / SO=protein_coding / is_pseudo=false
MDHNTARISSSGVFVMDVRNRTLSLKDVVISGAIGGSVIATPVFEVALSRSITAEQFSGESLLGNLTIRNVNRTTGNGVVMTKNLARIATSASRSGEITDSAMHGRRMKSICSGVRHIEMSVTKMILINGECPIGGVCEIGDLNVKSLKRVQATIHFNAMIEEDEMNGGSVIVFVDECVVERCGFVFGEVFEGVEESVLKEKDGRLEISECFFSSLAMDLVMKSTMVSAESGELKIAETIFDGICTTAPFLSYT